MNVDLLGGEVTLAGTVHVSPESRTRVISTIRDLNPDVVAIELDANRYYQMRANPDARNGTIDLFQTVLTGDLNPKGAIAQYTLSKFQDSLTDDLDIEIGHSDFIPAVDTAHELDIDAAFIDDTAQRTVNEIGSAFTLRNILSGLMGAGVFELVSSYTTIRDLAAKYGMNTIQKTSEAISVLEEMEYEDIERVMEAYETLAPKGTFDHFLHDRNAQMAGRIHWLQQNTGQVVAVMGRAHVPGVQQYLETPKTIPEEYVHRPNFVPVDITVQD